MNPTQFQTVDQAADTAFDAIDDWLDSPKVNDLKAALKKAAAALPESYSLDLVVELRVYDGDREKSMRLLTMGLSANPEGEPYKTSGDSTVHRYLVDGELCQIPHNYCPHCWGEWDFKLNDHTCPECGYSLGKEVRLMLDSDVCPHCEKGTITMAKPRCDKCGFEIDPNFVTWG